MPLFSRKKDRPAAVTNANYDRVLSVVNRYLDESRIPGCVCEQCVGGIIAWALNCLPPHYYVERQRDQEAGSPWIMVESAVLEAIEMLREQPHRLCRRARVME